MRKGIAIGVATGGALVALAAAASTLAIGGGASVQSGGITVVGGASASGTAGFAPSTTSTGDAQTLAAMPCAALTSSAGATVAAPGTTRCGLPSHVTLQDRVYFGAYWEELQKASTDAPIVLGGGYRNAQVVYSSDGGFYDGVVERTDSSGRVTDVILAFGGSTGTDAVQGEAILAGVPLDEAATATQTYERLLTAYPNARIHVTGHSLGTGYTQYVAAYALATHGAAATDARADFLAFGAPNWLASSAAHFGVDVEDVAARVVDFTAANDPVLLNGVDRRGINNYLPAFWGAQGVNAAANVVAAHFPTTYAGALGLPSWLSAADQAAATALVASHFPTGDSRDPNWGPPGSLALTVDGTARAEWLQGLNAGDRLIGRGGADVLTGGAGADTFVYQSASDSTPEAPDRITDFSPAQGDRIDLSALSGVLGIGALRFVGSAPFAGRGTVRYSWVGSQTVVEADVNGDGVADLTIRLDGRVALTAGDFVLVRSVAGLL